MKTITIYTSPTCGFCEMAKGYLASKNIKFNEVDISTSVEATNWILNHTGQMGVPVINFDGNIVVGFNRLKIDEAIKNIS